MTTYFVIGMHRSGTSLVSNLMHYAGVHMFNSDARFPDKWNPQGYGEDESFKAVNKAILHDAGGWWACPPGQEQMQIASRAYIPELAKLIKSRNTLYEDWGIKDPRLCLVAQFYPISSVRCVFVQRNPEDIIKSLSRREEEKERFVQPNSYWRALVMHYLAAAQEFLDRQTAKVTIDYDRLTSEKTHSDEVKKLEGFIGKPVYAQSVRTRKES